MPGKEHRFAPTGEEKMPRRLVNIIKELIAWLDELEQTHAKHKTGET